MKELLALLLIVAAGQVAVSVVVPLLVLYLVVEYYKIRVK